LKLKPLLSIFFAILLILAFLTPGVMAKENQKYYSNNLANQIDDSNAIPLSKEDWVEIEEMVNMFLKEDGIIIENLDLSNLKKIETDDDLIFTGKVKYDIQSVNSKSIDKSISNLSKSQEMVITSKLDKVESSFKVESSSASNQSYKFDLHKDSKGGNGDYVIEERFSIDGRANVVMNSFSIPLEYSTSPAKAWNLTPNVWHDLPSNPPSGSGLVYNNGKLSSLILGGSIALGVAATVITAIATAGLSTAFSAGISVVVGFIVTVATAIVSNSLPKGVSTDFVELDYFFTYYPRPFYNASPAVGYAHPTFPIYGEIDRYFVVPPK